MNTAHIATLGSIGIAPLQLNINDQNFAHIHCVNKIEMASNSKTSFYSEIKDRNRLGHVGKIVFET